MDYLPLTSLLYNDGMKQSLRLIPLALWAAALLCAPAALAQNQAVLQQYTETAQTAFHFVDAIGIGSLPFDNIKGQPQNDPKFCTNIFAPAMRDLNITHFRTNMPWYLTKNPETTPTYIAFRCALANGLRPLLTMTLQHTNMRDPVNGGNHTEDPQDAVNVIKYLGPQNIDGVEGVNEYYNTNSDPNWQQVLLDYSRKVHDALKADPATRDVKIAGPSLNGGVPTDAYNDIVDIGTMHFYDMPYVSVYNKYFAEHAAMQAQEYPGKPHIITETGFSNCTFNPADAASHGGNCVTEAVAAKNIGRQLLHYFAQGYQRIYIYQLVDSHDNITDRDSNYGLLRITTDNVHAAPKPVYFALRNLTSILKDMPQTFAPSQLSFSLAGDLTNIQHVLLQKANGDFYLAIWQSANSMNNPPPIAVPVELKLNNVKGSMAIYDTVASDQPAISVPAADHITLSVLDSVLLVRITPGK